jgi:hypothetical protein
MHDRERAAHDQLIHDCQQARDDTRDLINHTDETIARSQEILRRATERMTARPASLPTSRAPVTEWANATPVHRARLRCLSDRTAFQG